MASIDSSLRIFCGSVNHGASTRFASPRAFEAERLTIPAISTRSFFPSLSGIRALSLWARTRGCRRESMRLAVFGAGGMGATHASAYAAFGKKERVEIAGIVSRSASKARGLAKRVDAPWFTDPQKILRDESIDAIDVTTPSGLHRPLVVLAVAQGKHVFCEAPVALTLRDADAMINAAPVNRRILMVAQVMRVFAHSTLAHRGATTGSLGKPRIVVARRLARPYWSAKRPRPFRVYGD